MDMKKPRGMKMPPAMAPAMPSASAGMPRFGARAVRPGGMAKGGKVKKAGGGEIDPPRGTSGRIHNAMRNAHGYAGNEAAPDAVGRYETPPDAVGYHEDEMPNVRRSGPPRRRPASKSGLVNLLGQSGNGMKKGGKVPEKEFEGSKMDMKQDKKLASKYGMSMKDYEKSAVDKKHDAQQSMKGLKKGGMTKMAAGGGVETKGKTKGKFI